MVAGLETARRSHMANIGSFKKSGNEYQGEIVTLSVQTKGVRIVPEANRSNDNAPSHRVFVGRAEIGAAWSKRSNEGRDYLSLKLDDPSFNAPIFANLFDDEDGEGSSLIWSRLVTYLRLLDADAEGADWREVARVVLHIDPDREPDRARHAFDSHLARAKWMTEHGYRDLLRGGASN
jgi:uncharacterized protein (DUF736 family)